MTSLVLQMFLIPLALSWVNLLLGIVVGHLYFFLTMQYPQEFGGRRLISTPQFL